MDFSSRLARTPAGTRRRRAHTPGPGALRLLAAGDPLDRPALSRLARPSAGKSALWRGWWYGFGAFGAGTSWIYVSIHDYGAASVPLASLLMLGFTAGVAFFFALPAWLWARCLRRDNAPLGDALAFAALWLALELFRSWFLTGFPWLYAGYSQLEGPLAGLVPLGGVWLVSFVIALTGALLVNLPRPDPAPGAPGRRAGPAARPLGRRPGSQGPRLDPFGRRTAEGSGDPGQHRPGAEMGSQSGPRAARPLPRPEPAAAGRRPDRLAGNRGADSPGHGQRLPRRHGPGRRREERRADHRGPGARTSRRRQESLLQRHHRGRRRRGHLPQAEAGAVRRVRAAAGPAARPDRLLRPADVRLRARPGRPAAAQGQGLRDRAVHLLRSGLPGVRCRARGAEPGVADHEQRHLVRHLHRPSAAPADGTDARPGSRSLDDPRDQQRRHRPDRSLWPDRPADPAVPAGHPARRGDSHAGPDALPAMARLAAGRLSAPYCWSGRWCAVAHTRKSVGCSADSSEKGLIARPFFMAKAQR